MKKTVALKLGIGSADQVRRTPWHVLRGNRDFQWYFTGSVISDLGTWLQNSAQVLLAYQLSHSVLTVGLVTFAQFTSPLVAGPWAGVVAEKIGGRGTLLITQVVSAVLAAVLAGFQLAGLLDEWGLCAGAIVSGLAFTFALPARNVLVQEMVNEDKLQPAYAMDTVSYNIGRFLAPLATAGLALGGISLGWAFTANALSFLAFAIILRRVHLHGKPFLRPTGRRLLQQAGLSLRQQSDQWVRWRPEHRRSTAKAKRSTGVRDGFRIARSDRRILILLLMVAAVTVADDPILVLGPALARQLHVSTDWSSCFIAALGAGTVISSFRPSRLRPSMRLAATSLALLAGSMLLFVHAPATWVALLAAVGAGASCLLANSVMRAVIVRQAGPDRTASVMAVWAIAWAGSKPFASLLDGTLGSLIGLRWTGIVLAAPALIPILVIAAEPLAGFWARKRRGLLEFWQGYNEDWKFLVRSASASTYENIRPHPALWSSDVQPALFPEDTRMTT